MAKIKIKGVAVSALLPEVFKKAIASLEFPKNMTWEESGFRFARPIRGISALYGDKVVKFELAGVKSGRKTRPLSSFGAKGVEIKNADSLENALKHLPQPILINPEERKEVIRKALAAEARRLGAIADEDEALIEDTAYMTEHPAPLSAGFDERFLTLPKYLITTVMKTQIKMFPVLDGKGGLKPDFIVFRDGLSVNQKEVAQGFRKVLSARLSDAVFFFEADAAKGLKHFKEKLSGVQFIEGFGTMLEKTDRVKKLALVLAGEAGADLTAVSEMADHAYADLTCAVVYEFPELQGYMGSVYAEKEGMDKDVCKGLEEFYYPVNSTGELPSSKEAALVSLAGKLDAVTGNFAAGNVPTGSEDPYALRRQAMGIVRILLEKDLPLNIEKIVAESVMLYSGRHGEDVFKVPEFIFARFTALMAEEGIAADVINALSGRVHMPLKATLGLARALNKSKENPAVRSVAQSAKRVSNILKKNQYLPDTVLDPGLFTQPEEKALYEKMRSVRRELEILEKAGFSEETYEKIFGVMSGLEKELADFFDKVMVNADDEKVKWNRYALLQSAAELLMFKYADITKLQ
jgi:glycyl-tRNA synthetase beta chain